MQKSPYWVVSGWFAGLFCLVSIEIWAQCVPYFPKPLSSRVANYDIEVSLDHVRRRITASQTIRWHNQSPVAVAELQFYMYLNAFKNSQSTFLGGTAQIFGQNFTERRPDEWGWIHIDRVEVAASDSRRPPMTDLPQHYIQLDDGNPHDQSVLAVPLPQPIAAGDSALIRLTWQAQMPRTIARAGFNQDFYLFCHWFPQLGVFEQNRAGTWHWNCHQFFRSTEFYADFGVYDVKITTPQSFVIGASGCQLSEKMNTDGTVTRRFRVEDVIDFAWAIYPRFQVLEDRWQSVALRILYPPEHAALAPRYLHALHFAFDFMEKHVGKYPYPSLTVVDPPFHALQSGLMEYPTLVTVGTFYGMPRCLRLTEALVVHEFVHQYFMGMVATNEKEEPWLDEGFVTYLEDRIIDACFGKKRALADCWGYHLDSRELTRTEYTTMRNPREAIAAQPGWLFSERNYKPLVYSKTATALHSLQQLIGDEKMDDLLRSYFEKWKFKHPRGEDFMAHLSACLPDSLPENRAIVQFFRTAIFDAKVLDYAVHHISNEKLPTPQGVFGVNPAEFEYRSGTEATAVWHSKIVLHRLGDWVMPVEVLVTFADGSTERLRWSGEEGMKTFEFSGKNAPIISAHLDPEQKLLLDLDLNNNSLTLQPDTTPLWKYAMKTMFWVQQVLQMVSFLG